MDNKVSEEVLDFYKEKGLDEESIFCMLASEDVLKEDWLSPEDEEAWNDL